MTPHSSLRAQTEILGNLISGSEFAYSALDLDIVLAIASSQLILPWLARSGHAWPADLEEILLASLTFNRERNLQIQQEAIAIASLLNQVGIKPTLLKGAAYLAASVFEDPGERYVGDLDMLVSLDQSEAAVQVLLQNGYVAKQSYEFVDFGHHHAPLARPGAVPVELHRSLGLGVCKRLLPAEQVIHDSKDFSWGAARVRIPSPDHLVIHSIMHSQIHHSPFNTFWPPAKSVLDLRQLQSRFGDLIDWNRVSDHFRKAGSAELLALHLRDLSQLFGVTLPLAPPITGLTRLRQLRRDLLRRWWKVRYLDPAYMGSSLLTNRFNLLSNLVHSPGGLRFLAKRLIEPGIYKRLVNDLMTGRGK